MSAELASYLMWVGAILYWVPNDSVNNNNYKAAFARLRWNHPKRNRVAAVLCLVRAV